MRKLALLGVALLLTACASKQPPRLNYPEPRPEEPAERFLGVQTEPKSVAALIEGKTNIIRLQVTEEGFEPAHISVKPGTVVRLHVTNRSERQQNLVLERFMIYARDLAPGEENYIEFTADAKGNWPFYSDAGQEGTPIHSGSLKVE